MVEKNTAGQETLENIESHVPDSMHPVLEAAFKYRKQLLIGVGAIIAATVLYTGINAYNQRAMAKAQSEMGSILIEKSGQEKIDALEGLLASAPSSVKPAVLLELAQAAMTAGDFAKAAGYWNQLAGTTDDDLKVVARMGKAKCLQMEGKPAEAVTVLKDLQGVVQEEYSIPVTRQLAVAAEAAGDTALALQAYKDLAEQPVSDKPYIDFKVAQLEAK